MKSPLRVQVTGPLERYAAGFVAELVKDVDRFQCGVGVERGKVLQLGEMLGDGLRVVS